MWLSMWRGHRPHGRGAVLSTALALGLALSWTAPAWARSTVTAVRIGEHPAMTRFVLDVSEPVEFRIFSLADPYRVVIDFPELSWQVPAKKGAAGAGLVKGYRAGLFKPGTWRIVLDAAAPVRVRKTFVLKPAEGHPYRFVLDLEKVSRATFLAAVKAARKQAAAPAGPGPAVSEPPPPAPAKPPGKRIVVLDPGHGGVDPGATGRNGTIEKRITLAMAREVKRQLEATGRYKVVLTRDRDIFMRLRARLAVARRVGADLFLSLHADTIANHKVRGLSVYTLSEKASDKEAAQLAAHANKSDLIAGIDLTNENPEVMNILIDLAQRETMNLSANFAQLLIEELRRDVKLLRKSHRFAGFAVLKAPDVPSALLELGYLSNRREEKQLRDPAYRARLGAALIKSVDRYFSWKEALNRS